MRTQRHVPLLIIVLLLAVPLSSRPAEHAATFTQSNLGTNVARIPIVADIEKDLSTITIASTERLIQTLEALRTQDLCYRCGLVRITEEERMKGPLKYDTFLKIQQELMRRGGELVRQAFGQVLVGENLAPDDKKQMRSYLRNEKGEDAPFGLPAYDRTQAHEYFLRFDPKKSTLLTVRKGDALVQIARRAYPQLSRWSAIDILAFINNLKNPEAIRSNQTLKIYEYEIVKDELAPWANPKSAIDN